jgi:hypothetical protein
VAVPFEQFKFQPSRTSSTGVTPAADTTAEAPGATTPAMTAPAPTPAQDHAAMVGDNSRQYYSIVLPSATKESLTSAAAFEYKG